MKLLVYAFAVVGFALWAFTPRRKPKRKPGHWLDPSPHRTLDLRKYGRRGALRCRP